MSDALAPMPAAGPAVATSVVATSVRQWQGMRSEYAWVRPHADADTEATLTLPLQIGIAFTGHRHLVYESAGRRVSSDIPPGSTIVSGAAAITWLRVHEVSEVLEIYPDPGLIEAVAAASGAGAVDVGQLVGQRDGTVLGIGSVLRRAHVCATPLSDVAASTLAHQLVSHLLSRYAGVQELARPGPGLLDARTIDRVTQFVDAGLHGLLTLDDLAAVARLSPFHFARGFCRTTGMPPHRFVTSRRMDRARHLLQLPDVSVEDVAAAVGFSNLSHFRRIFRDFHGVPPSAMRATLVRQRASG